MSVKVEKLEKNMAKLTMEVPAEELEKAIQGAYLKQKNRINIPGFRRGKAPRAMIEKMYGAGIFYEDAANALIPEAYSKAVDECGETIVSRPSISIEQLEKGKPFIFTAEVALKPEVVLGDYKGLEVPKSDLEVTEEEIAGELKREQENNSRSIDVDDRAVMDGDKVTLDFEGSVDGEAFEGGKGTDYPLTIGSGAFIPGFEEGVVGMKTGEEKDISVKFPEDYHAENLKGKDAVFHVKLHEIKKKEVPEFNDEFVKDVSEFDTVDAYRADIKKRLEEQNARRATQEMENALVDLILEKTPVNIPDCMIQSQIDSMVQEFEYRLMYQGLKLDDYLKYTGMKLEDLRKSYEDQAKKSVKTRLIFEAIIRQEKIEATEEDKQKKFAEMAEAAKKEVEEFKKSLPERQLEYIENEIIIDKLFALLNEWNPAS